MLRKVRVSRLVQIYNVVDSEKMSSLVGPYGRPKIQGYETLGLRCRSKEGVGVEYLIFGLRTNKHEKSWKSRLVQGWLPIGHRVLELGKALESLFKLNIMIDIFQITFLEPPAPPSPFRGHPWPPVVIYCGL